MCTTGMCLARDMTDQRFARLTVLGRSEERHEKDGHVIWLCRCDCGKLTHVAGRSLRCGYTRSCGCLSADANRRSRKQKVARQCAFCGATFWAVAWSRHCSASCRQKALRRKTGRCNPVRTVVCPLCGTKFLSTLTRR